MASPHSLSQDNSGNNSTVPTRRSLCISPPSVEDLRKCHEEVEEDIVNRDFNGEIDEVEVFTEGVKFDEEKNLNSGLDGQNYLNCKNSNDHVSVVAFSEACTNSCNSTSKSLNELQESISEVTVSAPVNIAVIKYWGKRDDELILPTNSSLSATLSQDILNSRTSVRCDSSFVSDRMWLNGIEVGIKPRVANLLDLLRNIARKIPLNQTNSPLYAMKIHIVSENNFPTAAGLASSASGYAALVFSIAIILGLPLDPIDEISRFARLGSGSACRSLLPGFAVWEMGQNADGSDSQARGLVDHKHWPDFEALILVVSDPSYQKSRPSTDAMASSVRSSPLAPFRSSHVVPSRLAAMETAIKELNFDDFAEICMRDSNQFHAICLDSFPPIFYLNDLSRMVITLVNDYNSTPLPSCSGKFKAAYSFDAGPNAVIFTTRPFVHDLLVLFEHYFPPPECKPNSLFFADVYDVRNTYKGCNNILQAVHTNLSVQPTGSVKRILHSRLGDGPRILARGHNMDVSLLNFNGFPRRVRD